MPIPSAPEDEEVKGAVASAMAMQDDEEGCWRDRTNPPSQGTAEATPDPLDEAVEDSGEMRMQVEMRISLDEVVEDLEEMQMQLETSDEVDERLECERVEERM